MSRCDHLCNNKCMRKLDAVMKATLERKRSQWEMSEVVKVQEMCHLQQVTRYEHEAIPAVYY